ncbi:hypothetical protein Atep_06150 [Allochromatium tepidum]|uniref:Uncharacterized protein n=2 Tax=Allochromatium tepidum TaxID=553982 RepID=A0ABN6G8F8_9GAMM|nr:hypothetical protein Atep_06150 [Allochromatium tepidum]
MIGATFGFLRFNSNPAQIFMGDTGSQFLGFGTAVLIILVTQRFDTVYGQLIPALILGIPVLDTAMVMIRRIRAGLSPFRPDRSPCSGWCMVCCCVSIVAPWRNRGAPWTGSICPS